MKRIFFTLFIAFFAWLTFINIFDWANRVLTALIFAKLIMTVLALFLTIVVQKLLLATAGSLILKDKIEELGDTGGIYLQTTKTFLNLFILFCLFRCQNDLLLWVYASTALLDNFVIYGWKTFIENMNKS